MINSIINSVKKTISRELVYSIASRLIVIVSGLFVSILTARILGPSGRGSYFFYITIALTVAQFCNFGMQTSNVYAISKDIGLLSRLEANSFYISFLVTPIAVIILCFILGIFSVIPSFSILVLMSIGLVAAANVYYLIAGNLLVGIGSVSLYNKIHVLSNIVVACIILLVVTKFRSFQAVLFATALGWFGVALLTKFLLYQKSKLLVWKMDCNLLKSHAQLSFKAYLSCALGFFLLKLNVFFLSHYWNSEVIGYYSIASQINDTICILPSMLGFLLFPNLVKNIDSSWLKTKESMCVIFVLMLIACIGIFILSQPLIVLVFGSKYYQSAAVIDSMLPGLLCFSIISVLSQYLATHGYPVFQVVIWFFAIIFSSLLNFFFVPLYGAVASGFSQSATYLLVLVLMFFLVRNVNKNLMSRSEYENTRLELCS